MSNEGLYQYVAVINKVIELAMDIQNQLNASVKGYVFDPNREDSYLKKEYKMLTDFLTSLDFETIKVIQTLMYIGRDFNDSKGKCNYNEFRKEMDNSWNDDKNIEVMQISHKGGVLAGYLIDGCKKIGLEI